MFCTDHWSILWQSLEDASYRWRDLSIRILTTCGGVRLAPNVYKRGVVKRLPTWVLHGRVKGKAFDVDKREKNIHRYSHDTEQGLTWYLYDCIAHSHFQLATRDRLLRMLWGEIVHICWIFMRASPVVSTRYTCLLNNKVPRRIMEDDLVHLCCRGRT